MKESSMMSRQYCIVYYMYIVVTVTLDLSSGQSDSCPRCSGQSTLRFQPHITDLLILTTSDHNETSKTTNFDVDWTEPSACCEVCYQVDILSPIMSADFVQCSLSSANASRSRISLMSDCELCIFQISVLYRDGVVTAGPCHIVNITSFRSYTYDRPIYSTVKIEIVFQSCHPGSSFVSPVYEMNGMVIHGSDLNNYITRDFENNAYFFTISNVTENITLLEYCILPTEVLCGICENSRNDIILSRSEVFVNSGPRHTGSSSTMTESSTPTAKHMTEMTSKAFPSHHFIVGRLKSFFVLVVAYII